MAVGSRTLWRRIGIIVLLFAIIAALAFAVTILGELAVAGTITWDWKLIVIPTVFGVIGPLVKELTPRLWKRILALIKPSEVARKKAFVQAVIETAENDLRPFFGKDFEQLPFYTERSIAEGELRDPGTTHRTTSFAKKFEEFLAQEQVKVLLLIGMGDVGKSWAMAREVLKLLPKKEKGRTFPAVRTSYLPVTLLVERMTDGCALDEAICAKLRESSEGAQLVENKQEAFDEHLFWDQIGALQKETKGVVFFIDDLSKAPPNCPEFYRRNVGAFVQTAAEKGCRVVMNARTTTYFMQLEEPGGEVAGEDQPLFGLQAKVIAMPLFTPAEAYQAWEKRGGPIREELLRYIQTHQFLCHPLILKYTVDLAKKEKAWHPKSKLEVFESLLRALFKELPEKWRREQPDFQSFFRYLSKLAKAVLEEREEAFQHERQIDAAMTRYQLYRSEGEKTVFVHDTFHAYLLMKGLMLSNRKLKAMTKPALSKLVQEIWSTAQKREVLLEVVEFTILQLLQQQKEAVELKEPAGKIIARLIAFGEAEGETISGTNEQLFELWFFIGLAMGSEGYFSEELACYDKSLVLRPDHPSTLTNKGVALFKLGRLEEVLACFDKSLALQPDHPTTLYNKGIILAELGQLEEALACYDKSLVLQPDDPSTLTNKGAALFLVGWRKRLPASTSRWRCDPTIQAH